MLTQKKDSFIYQWMARFFPQLWQKVSKLINYSSKRDSKPLSKKTKFYLTWLMSKFPFLIPILAKRYQEKGVDISYSLLRKPTSKNNLNSKKSRFNSKRSILFLHHCYYNFYYLAEALRKRGWDALSVSLESPNNPNTQFYHGEDLNLFDENPEIFQKNILSLFHEMKNRFRMLHFHARGRCSFFPSTFTLGFNNIPWDFLELRRLGIKIGYSHSGCNDLVRQSIFYEWSKGGCDRCQWKNQPLVCSDSLNGDWGQKLSLLSDLICVETDPTIDFKGGKRVYHEPLTFAIDPDFWSDSLEIPPKFKIEKKPDEFLVYHSVGNYKLRTQGEINFKGTEAVTAAIQRLQEEGYPIRLMFVDNLANRDVRFIQSQCDIAVDQLNYGRYGANTRELMMLGIPVIAKIDKEDSGKYPLSKCIKGSPIINADLNSIYSVLKYYIENKHLLSDLKKKMRAHALEWWSADKCAERFERVYDALMAGKSYSKIRKIL